MSDINRDVTHNEDTRCLVKAPLRAQSMILETGFIMTKENKHFTDEDRKQILQLIFNLLKREKVQVKRYGKRKVEFLFPIDGKDDGQRIYLNQIDLVEFFTTINSVHVKIKDRLTIVSTIKEGYVDIVKVLVTKTK